MMDDPCDQWPTHRRDETPPPETAMLGRVLIAVLVFWVGVVLVIVMF